MQWFVDLLTSVPRSLFDAAILALLAYVANQFRKAFKSAKTAFANWSTFDPNLAYGEMKATRMAIQDGVVLQADNGKKLDELLTISRQTNAKLSQQTVIAAEQTTFAKQAATATEAVAEKLDARNKRDDERNQ